MSHKVCKFGGSSVATASNIKQIVNVINEDSSRRVIVLSAPGKASGVVTKVTDYLITISEKELDNKDSSKACESVKARYFDIYGELGVDKKIIEDVVNQLDERINADKSDPARFRDNLVAAGEQFSAQLFNEYLKSLNIKSVFASPQTLNVTVTSDHGDAQITSEGAKNLTKISKLAEESIVIFPGFYGMTSENHIATFSRGGSDLTGALIADAINAIEYENFTDVNGILSANPKIITDPEQIVALTYREMRELSYMGFNVFHEEAVKPVMDKKIPIRLRNTNNTKNEGTLIVSERLPDERDIIGIASAAGYCSFNLSKFLMDREKGFGRKLLQIFEDLDLSYEHSPSGVDDLSVVLDQNQLHPGTVNEIIRQIEQVLAPDDVKVEFGLSLISVVGEGLLHKIGVLGSAAMALSNANINVKIVNQGSSELSIIFGIDSADEERALKVLYECFFN
jgi:aspartate kinase